MAEIVNMHQATSMLSRLVERAVAGDEIVIARNGKPAARLTPVLDKPRERIPGRFKGRIWMAPDFDVMSEEEIADWEGR